MYKNIVIEGPNNVGKSTLIEELLELEPFKNWRVEHMTENSPNSFEFYDATLSNCHNTIFDRHCIGEIVYPKLFNRKTSITEEHIIELVKCNNETLFIFVTADLNFINNAYIFKDELRNWFFITNERNAFDNAYNMLKENENVILLVNEWEQDADLTHILGRIKCNENS
jgi:GTPase SAR1 family protein